MNVFLSASDYSLGYELTPCNKRVARAYEKETGHDSVLFQSDWDFPSLAESLGWSLRRVQKNRRKPCDHCGTDGTVVCPDCGLGAGHFIEKAQEWLDKRVNSVFRVDCEYFG